MSIGKNIRSLRESRGLSQIQLGKIAGVTDKAVSTWERDEKVPRMGAVDKMVQYFGVTRSAILEDSPSRPAGAMPMPEMKKIPIVGAVRAGFGSLAYEDREGYDYADVKNASEYFYLRVTGDSMAPTILEGDLALIHTQPDVESGEIAVVLVNGDEGTVKRVVKRPGALMLQPLNPAYSPLLITGEELRDVRIAGKVMEIKRKF